MSDSLVDPYRRVVDYLRVSITDLCNLRCLYCRPPEGLPLISHDEVLRYEEILTIIRLFRDMGVRKLRITGGEPLVRRGVLDFISMLTSMDGIEDVGLTTNGVLLASMARGLRDAGLTRINISLDSMRRETFKEITGSDRFGEVMDGIRAALNDGFDPVKINVVLLEGTNEEDIPAFTRLTLDHHVDVRFIERMPFGANPVRRGPDSFSARKALEIISREIGEPHPVDRDLLGGPATMFGLPGAKGRIGVIDPVTGHFCGTCNRMRLTARGTLRPCLLSPAEIDIKTALRRGASLKELAEIVRSAVLAKPVGHALSPAPMADGMNLIGG
ncbi:MAG: GTP 3',8-cyclase MoaA [Desulfomonilaceae bacterium]